ncbi:MAG: heavy metal sensor histidine kinase [Rhodocyclaceae bacterium]
MRLRGPRSITFRLTALFAIGSTAVLLALGLMIGEAVERHFVEQDVAAIGGRLKTVAHLLSRVRSPADLDALLPYLDDTLTAAHRELGGSGAFAIAILAGEGGGRTMLVTRGVEFPAILLDRSMAVDAPVVWRQDGRPWRGISARLPTGIEGWPSALVAMAIDITHHEHFMAAFRRTLWSFVAFAAALTGLFGWAAVRRGLAPLSAIRREAEAVTASRLHHRLRTDAVPVELTELAATLNGMLARLEDSFRRLSEFSGDIAHELRTPVANLMTETQVVLAKARSADEYREVLAANAEEYERLSRMISDMLFLAQADHGLIVPSREPVELDAQVRELFDFYDALAEDKGVRLILAGQARVTGDRLMLRRALSNLLANAIRHTPAGGEIRVRLDAAAGGAVTVAVENTGEPIAPEHLPRLFDRFYRADPSRHHGSDGAGLGLAITRSIVRAHGGEITVASGPDGTCFEIRLPGAG